MKRSQSARLKTIVTSFISGKGGVGKTTIASSVAKLLSDIGFKVLMIDTDLLTNGLTVLSGPSPDKIGIFELYERCHDYNEDALKAGIARNVEDLIYSVSTNLDLIQSSSVIRSKHSEVIFDHLKEFDLLVNALIDHLKNVSRYDFIILDSQAGSVPTTYVDVRKSDKVVIVMEPDPMVTQITYALASEIRPMLPSESFFLVNKLSTEEASAYAAIERFLKILNHLPPIPFDFEVRRNFMLRRIPFDLEKPSPFTFGLIRMSKDLFPQIDGKLTTIEKDLKDKALQPTRERLRSRERDLEKLVRERTRLEEEVYSPRSRVFRPDILSAFFVVTLSTALVVFLAEGNFGVVSPTIIQGLTISIIAAALLALNSAYRKYALGQVQYREMRESLAILNEKISLLRSEIEAGRSLIASELKEYGIPSDTRQEK